MTNISKTKLLNIIKESKGKFFSVTWIKKDGSERTVVGKVAKEKFQNKFGYIVVKEGSNEYKLVDPRTLKSATIDKIQYSVKN